MIESFPARSEACQKSCKGPQEPLEKLVCRKRKELGAERGSDFYKKGESSQFTQKGDKKCKHVVLRHKCNTLDFDFRL